MNTVTRVNKKFFVTLFSTALGCIAMACSSDGDGGGDLSGTGGALSNTGGAAGAGAPGVGGSVVASGGTVGAGGGPASSGGGASGGFPGTGGAVVGTGGSVQPGSGGATAAGGTTGTSGGATAATGGATGTGGSAPVTCPATSTLPKGETTQTIDIGGVSRTYILHVPAKYTGAAPAPLVVDWHPILATASFERGNSGYAALSDSEGFIVAYPQGIGNAWNVGACCTTSRTVDDLGFAKALVEKIKSQGCIDPKRVYSTGYSMGGGMTHYLACNAADVFAAASPAAFDLLTEEEEPCKPSRPISVRTYRGTADAIVPYGGGASSPPNGVPVTIHFLGAVKTFEKWGQLNGCTGTPTAGAAGCQTYPQCKDGVEVTLCTATGGGHVTGDAKAGWAMMQSHPML